MIFDLKKYSQKYAFEDEEGNKITYGEIEALSEKIRKKIGTRKLVCILSNNTTGALPGKFIRKNFGSFVFKRELRHLVECHIRMKC